MGCSEELRKSVDKGEKVVLSALAEFPQLYVKLAVLAQARRKLTGNEMARKQLVIAKALVKEWEGRLW